MPICCGRWFNENGYRNHLDHSAAHANQYECHYCYDQFRTTTARQNHEEEQHWHHCQDCNWRFKHREDLDSHVRKAHPIECEICDRTFGSQLALNQHMNSAKGHQNYCFSCRRSFADPNALKMHLKSSVHVGKNVKCPWCSNKFTNLTGVTLHLESGKCSSGIDRQQIDNYCRQIDRDHLFTNRLIEYHGSTANQSTTATTAAWNYQRQCYECYFCPKGFKTLLDLNKHLNSPVHQQKAYHCFRCSTEFVALSGLVNHLESEKCGQFRSNKIGGTLGTVASRLMIAQ